MAVKKKYSASEEELKFAKFVDTIPDQSSGTPWYKSYPRAAARGAIKGTIGIGKMMSGSGNVSPQEEKETQENLDDFLDEHFPTDDDLVSRGIERGTEGAIEAGSFPGGTGAVSRRAFAGGGLAEAAKDLGAPDWAQTGIEVAAQGIPGLSKKIPGRSFGKGAKEEKQLMEYAREMGMTEQELALAVTKENKFTDFLSEFAHRGTGATKALDRTKQGLGRVWNGLRSRPEATQPLNAEDKSKLINSISTKMSKMPAEQVKRIREDYKALLRSPMTGGDVIDFWQKLNYYIKRGETGVGLLKEDLKGSLNSLSPKLGNDFELTNKLYQNFAKTSERLKPSLVDKLILGGESSALLFSAISGNYPLMSKVLGEFAARNLAREFLINPRLKNMSSRLSKSISSGSPRIAQKVLDQMVTELGKTNAEAAMKLSEMDIDDFMKSLPKASEVEE